MPAKCLVQWGHHSEFISRTAGEVG
jgi:hypothetical protein